MRLRSALIAFGSAVVILVVSIAVFSLYIYLTYRPSTIVDFHPKGFNAVASKPFFYSVGKELKYGAEINEQTPSLLYGDISKGEVSPDGGKIAVIADGYLKVVNRRGGTVETVAKVKSIFKSQNRSENNSSLTTIFSGHQILNVSI